MPELLSDLEKFWHNEKINVPKLIRVALTHYQFETIHPFLDGNGRIGRLLIPLYFISNGLLDKPSLYLSAHLERYRDQYYDALMRVRMSNDIGHWCRFFLQAVIDTSKNGKNTFDKILTLRQEVDSTVFKLGRRAENAQRLIRYLYERPVVSLPLTEKILKINRNPARELIAGLEKVGILKEITGFRRNRVFLFHRYLDIFKDHEVKK